MAGFLTDASKNTAADAIAAIISYVSAHTGVPGSGGANEVSGGAYARQAISFNAASGGVITNTAQIDIPIPVSTTVAYIGVWTALSGGTFRGYADITDEVFSASGTCRIAAGALSITLT